MIHFSCENDPFSREDVRLRDDSLPLSADAVCEATVDPF